MSKEFDEIDFDEINEVDDADEADNTELDDEAAEEDPDLEDEMTEEDFDSEDDETDDMYEAGELPEDGDDPDFTESDFDENDIPAGVNTPAEKTVEPDEYSDEDFAEVEEMADEVEEEPEKKSSGLVWKIGLGFLALVIIFSVWVVGTDSGREFGLRFVAKFIKEHAGTNDDEVFVPPTEDPEEPTPSGAGTEELGDNGMNLFDENGNLIVQEGIRSEDYVKTYLIFGIESVSVDSKGNVSYDNSSIGNTDAILMISVNSKDKKIKMTSIMRDTYVAIPNTYNNKINATYSIGARGSQTAAEAYEKGASLLVRVIEDTFKIDISGWACVNFNSFEKIVNILGGVDIELGEKEARYLNRTNYIRDPANRNLSPGMNHMNGDQVRGYCRVRKEVTLGGASNDYGRTVRQRRVISAIIAKYKSSSLTSLLPILADCLGYVHTNLSEDEITEALTMVVNNSIYETESLRLPVDGSFHDSGKSGISNGYRNITYTLVMDDLDKNIKELYKFVFLDEDETEESNGAQQ